MSSAAALTSGLAVTAFIAELLFGLTTFGAGITFNVAIHLLSLLGLVDGTSKSAVLALALPEAVAQWSLTSLREKLVKIGAKVVRHARYAIFQMAEVAVAFPSRPR